MCIPQAIKVLYKLIQQPICQEKLKALFTKVFMGLVFQIPYTAELLQHTTEIFWTYSEWHQANQPSPFRCSIPLPLPFPWALGQGTCSVCDWTSLCMQVCSGGH